MANEQIKTGRSTHQTESRGRGPPERTQSHQPPRNPVQSASGFPQSSSSSLAGLKSACQVNCNVQSFPRKETSTLGNGIYLLKAQTSPMTDKKEISTQFDS